MRKEIENSALVSAHYNLKKNTVTDIESTGAYWHQFISGLNRKQLMRTLAEPV